MAKCFVVQEEITMKKRVLMRAYHLFKPYVSADNEDIGSSDENNESSEDEIFL